MSGLVKTKLFVGHLPDACNEYDLRRLFEEYGEVIECDVINKYAFVHMGTAEQANEAVKNLNYYRLMGSKIIVKHSVSKFHPEPNTPGRAIKQNLTRNVYTPPHPRRSSNTYEMRHFKGSPIGGYSSSDHSFRFRGSDRMMPYPPSIQQCNMGFDPFTCSQLHMTIGTCKQDNQDMRRSPPLRMTAKEAPVDDLDNNTIRTLAIDLEFEREGCVIVDEVSGVNINLPPRGELKRKDLQKGTQVWAEKDEKFVLSTVKVVVNGEEYEIQYKQDREGCHKLLNCKQLAYNKMSLVIIPVATRVLAWRSNHMFAGVVAEIPKLKNNYRYLIFFDDGFAQYFLHKDIRLMCAQSPDVSHDMALPVRDIIKSYFSKYPEWPLFKLKLNQRILVEYEFEWLDATVAKIDSSMVRVNFWKTKRQEWIYRGSSRFQYRNP